MKRMHKRGMELKPIVEWLLLLVVILTVLLIMNPNLRKVGDWFGSYSDKVFKEMGLGKQQAAPATEIDQNVKTYFEYLYKYFSDNAAGTDCVLAYNQQPILGDYRIKIYTQSSGLYMQLLNGQGQMVEILPKTGSGPDMEPCIIAGSNNAALNFKSCKLESGVCSGPMYSSGEILLYGSQMLNLNGKNYRLDDSASAMPGINILYKFDGKHACFFTTNPVINDRDGLNDDIIQDIYMDKYPVMKCTDRKYCTENKIKDCSQYDEANCKSNTCRLKPSCFWTYGITVPPGSLENTASKQGHCTDVPPVQEQ